MKWYKSDYHNHSNLSVCAKDEMSVKAMIKKFEDNGLKSVGISDHIYTDGKTRKRYDTIKSEIQKVKTSICVYIGCEVDIISPGKLRVAKEELEVFDYTMIACTHYHLKSHIQAPLNFNYDCIAQNAYDYMISASVMGFADIIVHPFDIRGLKSYKVDFDISEAMKIISDKDFSTIAVNMKENSIAVEINSNVLDKEYADAVLRFHRSCKKEGLKFSLGSDAHWLEGMCDIKYIKYYIDELGLTEEDIWTI